MTSFPPIDTIANDPTRTAVLTQRTILTIPQMLRSRDLAEIEQFAAADAANRARREGRTILAPPTVEPWGGQPPGTAVVVTTYVESITPQRIDALRYAYQQGRRAGFEAAQRGYLSGAPDPFADVDMTSTPYDDLAFDVVQPKQ